MKSLEIKSHKPICKFYLHLVIILELKNTFQKMSTKKQIPCQECGKVFESQRYLGYHIRRKHVEDVPKVETSCGKKVASKPKKNDHEAQCASRGIKCDICLECFIGKPKLNTHLTVAHLIHIQLNPEDEQHRKKVSQVVYSQCQYCTFHHLKFKEVINHIKLTHANVNIVNPKTAKRYNCDICEKSFKSKSQMDRHKDTVHIQSLQYANFSCDICEKYFVSLLTLRKHYSKRHQKGVEYGK